MMTGREQSAAMRDSNVGSWVIVGFAGLALGVVSGWLIAWLPADYWLLSIPVTIACGVETAKWARRTTDRRGVVLLWCLLIVGVVTMGSIAASLPNKYLDRQLEMIVNLPQDEFLFAELVDPDAFELRHLQRVVHIRLQDQDKDVLVHFPARIVTYRQIVEAIEEQSMYRCSPRALCAHGCSIRWGCDAGYYLVFRRQGVE